MGQRWQRVILDEAHLIRNRTTYVSQACCDIDTKFRWCLTGTPLQNRIDDLFAYFKFLKVPQLGELRWWNQFIQKNRNKEKTYQFIKAVLKGIMLRRTKTTVDSEGKPIIVLPKKTLNVENINFNKFEGDLYTTYFSNQQKLFTSLLKVYEQQRSTRGQIHEQMFVMINNLRMMCNNFQMVKLFQDSSLEDLRKIIIDLKKETKKEAASEKSKWEHVLAKKENPNLTDEQIQEKLGKMTQEGPLDDDDDEDEEKNDYNKLAKTDRVLELIQQVADRGEKVVLFTQWHDSISRLKKRFTEMDIEYSELHGKMTIKQRAKQVNEFFKLKSKTVLILSLMAGCVGLNLTIANNVIVMDPWWNGAIEEQAIDRIYRIGQKKDVNVFRCLISHPDSIDIRISELCKKKEAMCNKILSLSSDERSISQNLTIEDFKFIFGLSNAQVPPEPVPMMASLADMSNINNMNGSANRNMHMSQSINNNRVNQSVNYGYNNQALNNSAQNNQNRTSIFNSNGNSIYQSQNQNSSRFNTPSQFNRANSQQLVTTYESQKPAYQQQQFVPLAQQMQQMRSSPHSISKSLSEQISQQLQQLQDKFTNAPGLPELNSLLNSKIKQPSLFASVVSQTSNSNSNDNSIIKNNNVTDSSVSRNIQNEFQDNSQYNNGRQSYRAHKRHKNRRSRNRGSYILPTESLTSSVQQNKGQYSDSK